jgi:hypothetical protein
MSFRFSRYQNRVIFQNNDPSYIKKFSSRNVSFIDQYATAKFTWDPSLDFEEEYWSVGFRFYKLAHKYYGDAGLWWIIPWFNQKPLESDFDPGDLVMIPVPLEQVLNIFREA